MGHAHIDTAWLWPLAETRRKCIRTFTTAVRQANTNDLASFTSGWLTFGAGGFGLYGNAITLGGNGISGTGALRNISGTNTYAGLMTLDSATRINSDTGLLTFDTAANSITGTQNLTLSGAGNGTISANGANANENTTGGGGRVGVLNGAA